VRDILKTTKKSEKGGGCCRSTRTTKWYCL